MNQIPYYVSWVSGFFAYHSKKPGDAVNPKEIDIFTHNLSKTYEEWLVSQAREALRLYLFFRSKAPQKHSHEKNDRTEEWGQANNEMVNALRLRHRSLSTEKTYLYWIRMFCKHLKGSSPYSLDNSHFTDFMTYLAV